MYVFFLGGGGLQEFLLQCFTTLLESMSFYEFEKMRFDFFFFASSQWALSILFSFCVSSAYFHDRVGGCRIVTSSRANNDEKSYITLEFPSPGQVRDAIER